jgi:hypothetical protein
MKNNSSIKLAFSAVLICTTLFQPLTTIAQTAYSSKLVTVTIKGTSNVHDWEMKAANGRSEATFVVDATGKVTGLSKMSFSLPAKSLKSQHSGMDNNTYKALKTDKSPNLTFVLTSAVVTPTSANNYLLKCQGQLSIAGKTNQTEIMATGVYNPADKSFVVSGLKKMKMTDYNVDTPKALFGTIKTGNEISVGYSLKFTK